MSNAQEKGCFFLGRQLSNVSYLSATKLQHEGDFRWLQKIGKPPLCDFNSERALTLPTGNSLWQQMILLTSVGTLRSTTRGAPGRIRRWPNCGAGRAPSKHSYGIPSPLLLKEGEGEVLHTPCVKGGVCNHMAVVIHVMSRDIVSLSTAN